MSLKKIQLKDDPIWVFWKKYGDHFVAPLILIALIFLSFQLYNDNMLKKQINKNCGWGQDDYRCYCEKSEAIKIKNLIDGNLELNFTFNLSNQGIEKAGKELQKYYEKESSKFDNILGENLKNDSLGN